jgi:tetratricopeptide (TPR) repeat protein
LIALALAAVALAAAVAAILLLRREPALPHVSADPAVQAELERAVNDYLEADIGAAEESFASVAQKAPDAAWPHLGLSLVYALEDHFEDSRTELALADKLAAGQGDREAELIRLTQRSDEDMPAFLAAWSAYDKRFPRYFLAHQIIAYFLTNRGPVDDRLRRFDAALAIDDRHAITYLTKSYLLLRLHRWDDAEATVAAGLARRPTSSWLLGQRAVVRMVKGDRAAARQDFERALAHGAPISAHMSYAALLLNMGDEEARKGEVAVLRRTKRTEDRALFLCHHALALTRRGRAAEAAALFADAAETARTARRPGTLLRCAILEAMAGDALRRHAAAKARLAETAAIFASVVPMDAKDAADTRRLVTEQRGVLQAELGELGEAREAQRELGFAKHESAELGFRLALAEHRTVDVPEPAPEALVLGRVRRRLIRGRILEQAGRLAEAAEAYARAAGDRAECLDTERMADFPCGGHVADALVRGAALAARTGRPDDAKKMLATFHTFWPDADADLAVVKEAAEIERGLGR